MFTLFFLFLPSDMSGVINVVHIEIGNVNVLLANNGSAFPDQTTFHFRIRWKLCCDGLFKCSDLRVSFFFISIGMV